MVKLSTLLLVGSLALAAGCGTTARRVPDAGRPTITAPSTPRTASAPASSGRSGGYYLDDGPHDRPPVDPDSVPDAVPRAEPLSRGTLRPYTVMGRTYTPMTTLGPYSARGTASWYGRRYHGKQTSSGEFYDMYAMSAAHPTLPIPSYVRVTHLANGRSVVVRVNDRGPFIDSRLIDLSYTAAYKLGMVADGSAPVAVELIMPGAAATLPPPPPLPMVPIVPMAPTPAPAVPTAPVPPVATVIPTAPVAPAAPEVDEIERRIAMAAEASGYFLQLAAFGSRDNAEAYAGRLRGELPWMAADTLAVYPGEALFRVRAGPYASAEDARQAAERISQSLGLKPVIVNRP